MKTVFDNHMLAHVWAQRSQPYGRTSNGNFYFEAGTLYSYGSHFKVAKFVANSKGETCAVLFNERRYSMSTGRHQRLARNAVHGLGLPVMTVKNCDPRTDADHVDNFRALISRRDELAAKAERARASHRKDWARREAEHIDAVALEYARLFIKGDPTKLAAKLAKQDAKAARERKQREAERAAELAKIKAEVAPLVAELLASWRNGASTDELMARVRDECGSPYTDKACAVREMCGTAPTMLRVDGDEIETSRGARFPTSHAKLAYRFLKGIVAKGEAWEPGEHTVRLGHFRVDRVEADGTIRAGCHTVPWSEVEHCARTLGL